MGKHKLFLWQFKRSLDIRKFVLYSNSASISTVAHLIFLFVSIFTYNFGLFGGYGIPSPLSPHVLRNILKFNIFKFLQSLIIRILHVVERHVKFFYI